jgi:hypothetical protein
MFEKYQNGRSCELILATASATASATAFTRLSLAAQYANNLVFGNVFHGPVHHFNFKRASGTPAPLSTYNNALCRATISISKANSVRNISVPVRPIYVEYLVFQRGPL